MEKPVNEGGDPVNEGGNPVNEGGNPVNEGGNPVNEGGDPVNPKPKQDKCIDGIIKDGKCTCPPNKKLVKGACVIIECNGGRIIGGVCKCPPGNKLQNGNCIPEKTKCKPEEMLVKGNA
jgi:hypothetical protein